MEEVQEPFQITSDFQFLAEPPSIVTLTPFSHSTRRLSSSFHEPRQPIKAAKKLAWVSLQGRLVNADEASSAKTIGGGLGPKEAVAWDLFSPIHRILVVAVIAVAAANSKKNNQICQLNKAVEVRDQVLSSMQVELDNLCDELSYFKEQSEIKSTCQFCYNHNKNQTNDWMGHQMFTTPSKSEQEERRMSGLSDWSSSVTSSEKTLLPSIETIISLQLDTEQDIYNLQRECDDKDATIKELSDILNSSEAFGSKRIVELEDVIRRKNMIINRLKKDIMVLEQKVVNLTRVKRSSYSNTKSSKRSMPLMRDNVIYDMESSTSPSSSDSDSSPESKQVSKVSDNLVPNNMGQIKEVEQQKKNRVLSPLKEKSLNQKSDLRTKCKSSASGVNGNRRCVSSKVRDAVPVKRWA